MTPLSDTRAGIAGVAGFTASFVFAVAGALLIAPWVSLLALLVFPFDRDFWRFQRVPWALLGAFAFLAWMALSYLWSPYDDPGQIWRTGLGIPLYMLFAARVGRLGGRWRRRVEAAIIFLVVSLGLFLLYEAIFDAPLTRGYKMVNEEFGDMERRVIDIFVYRNLGHAAVPLILLCVPAAMMAWRRGSPWLGGLFVVFAAVSAFSFSTEVNAVAFLLGLLAAGCAALWPRVTVAVAFGGVAGLLLVLPLFLPELIAALPDPVREAVPLSWSWRLEIWTYACELIREQPIFGYGLDASRPLNREFDLEGFTAEALPMHPHNASLHVWLETGAIGAMLLAFTLVTLGGRISSALRLSRIQAVGVVWVFVVYASQIVFSYGVWQEWHQGTVALAATSVFFLGARKPA